MANLFIKKDLNLLISDAGDPNAPESGEGSLKRTLGPFNLIMIGIGAIIGAGLFVRTAAASADGAAAALPLLRHAGRGRPGCGLPRRGRADPRGAGR